MTSSNITVSPSLPLLPNLAQIPVIPPLAPHDRRLRHKLLGTDRADHDGHPLTERLDPESGMNLRENQPSDNFPSPIDAIIKKQPEVHMGDLFDTVKPGTRACITLANQG